MEQIINNPGFYYIAENIFQRLDLKDLSNCPLVRPLFWLKKLIRRGLSKKNQKDWIDAFDKTELLKRRGQEYFTLVLTKNYSNLVAALSYCSDEGN